MPGSSSPAISRTRLSCEAFAKNFDDGLDAGASVAVTLKGEMVVDLWGGVANDDGTRAWERCINRDSGNIDLRNAGDGQLPIADNAEKQYPQHQ